MEFPDDLRYTKEHEWARAEGGVVRVGITDFAQDALGDVVYVDLPDVGTDVHGEPAFGEVESTKSVSDVFSPVDGTIVERNPLIDDRPELVNEQPYGDGWLCVVEPADPAAARRPAGRRGVPAFVEEPAAGQSTNGRAVQEGRGLSHRQVERVADPCG